MSTELFRTANGALRQCNEQAAVGEIVGAADVPGPDRGAARG